MGANYKNMTRDQVEAAIRDYADPENVEKIEAVYDGFHPTAWAVQVTDRRGGTWQALVNSDGDGEIEEVEFTSWPPTRSW